MKTFLKHLFFNQWYHKCISIFLAVVIWLAVNHSQSTSKFIENIAVRVINIPSGSTVEGLLPNGLLNKRISLTVSGKKLFLDNISSNDIEVIIDGKDKTAESVITISKKNLFSLNPGIDLSKSITRIVQQSLPIHIVRMITEKIPVRLTLPVGEAPRNYEFTDVWPYNLYLTTSGPEPLIRDLKEKGLPLTFNLSEIPKEELDSIGGAAFEDQDEVSFFIPNDWKKIHIPTLSDQPIEINDPRANDLRIDFVRKDLHPITRPIPISIFYPPEYRLSLSPEAYNTCIGSPVEKFNGVYYINKALYAKGVSKLFVEVVQEMLDLCVIINPKNDKQPLDWSIQFINPYLLEERYLFRLSDISDEKFGQEKRDPASSKAKEEYYRNRFRRYMHQFQLYTSHNKKFEMLIEMKDHTLQFQEL
jgi:hypothetical protein